MQCNMYMKILEDVCAISVTMQQPKNSNLEVHIKAVHENIKDHNCTQCYFASFIKSSLILHIKVVHKNNRDHKCHKCDYAASKMYRLPLHIKSVHENINDHQCSLCKYSTSSKQDFVQTKNAVQEK
jgi:hypothetical protein